VKVAVWLLPPAIGMEIVPTSTDMTGIKESANSTDDIIEDTKTEKILIE